MTENKLDTEPGEAVNRGLSAEEVEEIKRTMQANPNYTHSERMFIPFAPEIPEGASRQMRRRLMREWRKECKKMEAAKLYDGPTSEG